MRLGALIVVIWLVIGAFAAYQSNYFSSESANCAREANGRSVHRIGTVLVTVVTGPLNYFGFNPQVDCELPQPSP